MILTGKAKEAFKKWFDEYSQEHHQKEWLDNDLYLDEVYLPDEVLNALVIEWLDSVGIYVAISPRDMEMKNNTKRVVFDSYVDLRLHGVWGTRQQATQKAIEKAIEIYNEKHK